MSKLMDFLASVPRPDVSGLRDMSPEDIAAACAKLDAQPKKDWRKFVENVEQHPEKLLSWDMDISFEEFARRVRAGEFD